MNDQSGLECRLETAKEDEKDEKVPKRKNASSLADISTPPTSLDTLGHHRNKGYSTT